MNTVYDQRLNDNWVANYVDVDYLVVAGGGGGAAGNVVGGGGGAGGYRASGYGPSPLQGCSLSLQWGTYPVTIGGGGSGTARGNDSVLSTITSTGGGAAFAAPVGPGLAPPAGNGGSGGGPNYNGSYPTPPSLGGTNPSQYSVYPGSTKGLGDNPSTSPPQGNPSGGGGFNDNGPNSFYGGGGGGGAGGVGGAFNVLSGGCTPTPLHAGDGGIGVGSAINPSPSVGTPGPCGSLRYFGGGGGAGTQGSYDSKPPIRAGIGGYGGGGCASACIGSPPNPWYPRTANAPGWCGVSGEAGTATSGGGGGAGGKNSASGSIPGPGIGVAGNGGAGVVIVRAPSVVTFTVSPGTNSTSTHPGGDKIATFTVNGCLTVTG